MDANVAGFHPAPASLEPFPLEVWKTPNKRVSLYLLRTITWVIG
jgi:hypothetical protein